MKYLITISFLILTGPAALAQWKQQHTLQFSTGFEKNVFLNPETFITAEGNRLGPETMWDNGLFQAVESNNNFVRKWKKGRLKLHANGGLGVYHTRESANRYHYELGGTFRTRFAERKYVEFAPNFSRFKRDGIDVSKAEIRQPFSFYELELPTHLDFYLKKSWWLKTEIGGIIKAYDRGIAGEKLRYGAPYGEVSLSKKLQLGKQPFKLSASSRIEHRIFYERSLVDDSQGLEPGSEIFESGSQVWTYVLHQLEVKWQNPKKNISVYVRPERLSRIDRDVELTYHQWGIKAGAAMRHKQWGVGLHAGQRNRYYPNLTPGRGNTESLRYNYFNASTKVKYQLNDKMQASLSAGLINRTSNNPSETMIGFRGFETAHIEVGFTMAF